MNNKYEESDHTKISQTDIISGNYPLNSVNKMVTA